MMKNKMRIRTMIYAVLIMAMLVGMGSVAVAISDNDDITANYTERVTPDTLETSRNMQQLAGQWAEAVKSTDGQGQYALMSSALQETVYDEFCQLGWVTGSSDCWVADYSIHKTRQGVSVVFHCETSAGSAGDYRQTLTFVKENDVLRIDSISELTRIDASMQTPILGLADIAGLIGDTKAQLLETVGETSYPVENGGLGFDRTGIRVWFDASGENTVARVRIMTTAIDLGGVSLGDSITAFKDVFGQPTSDVDGQARFTLADATLSVTYDTATGKTGAVYILIG